MNRLWAIAALACLSATTLTAQGKYYWQQRAEYEMKIDVDADKHQYEGEQTIKYYNNSPDTLTRVFYHLYFNAFQPGSMMDVRSRSLPDPDRRVRDRISKLTPDEIGYIKPTCFEQDGECVKDYKVEGTIMEVPLLKPLLPGESTNLKMQWDAQVPLQVRRSGRDNSEGIDFSMSQWYPKLVEYDENGWHPNPYVGREFYGVWGDFDVKIKIDKEYIVGGTGYLQNADEVGYGYEEEGTTVKRPKGKKLMWHFVAPDVHDFVWAADPDYKHVKYDTGFGTMLHFLYQEGEGMEEWTKLPAITADAMRIANRRFGKYPYKQYSVIQGGDGGMEYAMATLITGKRNLGSLVGVTVHEMMHSWYQGLMATDEARYAWMDEGFTVYAEEEIFDELNPKYNIDPNFAPHKGSYRGYAALVQRGLEEPLTTHADHFDTNFAYGIASYSKGNIFLTQLEYIIGEAALARAMLRYYDLWKYKHPEASDFIRIAENESNMVLDWYQDYWVNGTKTIDYGISEVKANGNKTTLELVRIKQMPMPLDVEVKLRDGSTMHYYIPLQLMRNDKPATADQPDRIIADDWQWTHPLYELEMDVSKADILSITIDPSERMADLERDNNVYTAP